MKEKYDFVGVRRSDENDETIDSRSTEWEDGEKSEDELVGLSTVDTEMDNWKTIIDDYHFEHWYIVAGDQAEDGNDFGESVIVPEYIELIDGKDNSLKNKLKKVFRVK